MRALAPVRAEGGGAARYILQSVDRGMVTSDLVTGPSLTRVLALAYTWPTQAEADGHRLAFEHALGVPLRVVELAR
jgi:hypothetical protein